MFETNVRGSTFRTFVAGIRAIAALTCLIALGGCGGGGGATSSSDGGSNDAGTLGADGALTDASSTDGSSTACEKPTFSPAAGAFSSAQSVSITTRTPSATIYFTTDGTIPTSASHVYSSPIAIATSTTVNAFCRAPGHADSSMVSATYAISVTPTEVAPPSFSVPAETASNDFVLSLNTTTTGATICFTEDGSTPSCKAGACQGPAKTYSPQSQISINGAVTDTGTGKVTISALACKAGLSDGVTPAQTYTLKVASLSIQGTAPGTISFGTADLQANVTSATTGATGWLTRDPMNPPSCTTGTTISLPSAVTVTPAAGNQSLVVVGCKAGYLPSDITTGTYTVQLNPPALNHTGGTYHATTAVVLDDSANAESKTYAWVCATTDGSTPGCTATGCTTGANHTGALHDGAAIETVDTNGAVIETIACTSSSPTFVDSTVASSGPYTLQLDPIAFSPPPQTPIPVAPGSLSVTFSQKNPGGDTPYDFLCYTSNGTTAPDCTCTSAGQSKVSGTSSPAIILAGRSAVTIQAIGCLSTTNANTFEPSLIGTAVYPYAGAAATPLILPAATTQNNATQIQFTNQDSVATVDICYTTDGTAPTCGGTCTAAVAPSKTVNGPLVSATATTVRALACDVSLVKSPSAEVTPPPVYTLQVGDVSIQPDGGAVDLGAAITLSTSTANATFHYLTNGNAPNCATSPTLNANGSGTATYVVAGNETAGALRVAACKPNFTEGAPATATFTYAVATPTFKFGTGTYDDTIADTVSVSPGIAGTWLCLGAGGACGTSASTCTGTGVTVVATSTSGNVSRATLSPITTSGSTTTVVACADPTGTVLSSSPATATYTLQTSAIRFVPTAGTENTPQNIEILLASSTTAPQGAAGGTSGVTSSTEVCVSTTQSPPPQPSPCSSFTSSAWTCATGGGTSGLGAGVSPIIGFGDVGQNKTVYAFTCRDGFVYQTATAAYTFNAYQHTIAMTGAVADFTPASEQIATADAGAFAYVSWNSANLYVGFDKGTSFAASDYVHFYVGGSSGGTQTTDTLHILSPQTLPSSFNALYHVWWKVDNTSTGIDSFNGTAWTSTSAAPTVKFNQGSTFVEIEVPFSSLGNPTDIRLTGGLWTGAASFGSWPVGLGTPTTDVSWQNFQDEQLLDAYTPNDPNKLNQP